MEARKLRVGLIGTGWIGELAKKKQVWLCTCAQMADFYRRQAAVQST
jgi:hypothetical protein